MTPHIQEKSIDFTTVNDEIIKPFIHQANGYGTHIAVPLGSVLQKDQESQSHMELSQDLKQSVLGGDALNRVDSASPRSELSHSSIHPDIPMTDVLFWFTVSHRLQFNSTVMSGMVLPLWTEPLFVVSQSSCVLILDMIVTRVYEDIKSSIKFAYGLNMVKPNRTPESLCLLLSPFA